MADAVRPEEAPGLRPSEKEKGPSIEGPFSEVFLARPTRFERATPAFGGQYSIHLSYGRAERAKGYRVSLSPSMRGRASWL